MNGSEDHLELPEKVHRPYNFQFLQSKECIKVTWLNGSEEEQEALTRFYVITAVSFNQILYISTVRVNQIYTTDSVNQIYTLQIVLTRNYT